MDRLQKSVSSESAPGNVGLEGTGINVSPVLTPGRRRPSSSLFDTYLRKLNINPEDLSNGGYSGPDEQKIALFIRRALYWRDKLCPTWRGRPRHKNLDVDMNSNDDCHPGPRGKKARSLDLGRPD